jgi:hypothetical protein
VIAPSTSLAARVEWLVDSPTFRPMAPTGDRLPSPETCWRCATNPVVEGSELCGDCRAWLRGDTPDEPPSKSTYMRERINTIISHMDDLGVFAMPSDDQRGVF